VSRVGELLGRAPTLARALLEYADRVVVVGLAKMWQVLQARLLQRGRHGDHPAAGRDPEVVPDVDDDRGDADLLLNELGDLRHRVRRVDRLTPAAEREGRG